MRKTEGPGSRPPTAVRPGSPAAVSEAVTQPSQAGCHVHNLLGASLPAALDRKSGGIMHLPGRSGWRGGWRGHRVWERWLGLLCSSSQHAAGSFSEQFCQEVLLALMSEKTAQSSAWMHVSWDSFLMSSGPHAPLGPQDYTGVLVVLFCSAQPSSVIRMPQITPLFVLCGEVSSPNIK